MEPGITLHLEEVGMLAAELSGLAAELGDGARICRSAGDRLRPALGGYEGWRAGALTTAWATVAEAVAARAGAVADSLVAATVSYRDVDAALASTPAVPGPGRPR
jgi:hypothetical protein